MKKSLLFSLALVPAAAFAGVVGANRAVSVPANMLKAVPASEQLVKAAPNAVKANLKANNAFNVKPKADVEAGYVLPDGSFFWGWGVSADGSKYVSMQNSFTLAPCNVPLTWENVSTGATSFTWTYPVDYDATGSSEVTETSTEKDLVWTPPCFYMFSQPVLAAGESEYSYPGYALYGGVAYTQGYYFLTYPDDFYSIKSADGGKYSYSAFWGASENTASYLEQIGFKGLNPSVTSMYQCYPASAADYLIESVAVRGAFDKYTSDKLIAKIWKVNEEGYLSDLMYEGYIDGSEVETSEENWCSATIPFYESDGELESQVFAQIPANTPIVIEITGFDAAKDSFLLAGLTESGEMAEDDATPSYFGVTYDGKSGRTTSLVPCGAITFGSTGSESHFALIDIATNMYYSYVEVDSDVFNFSTEGETKTLNVSSLFTSDSLYLEGEGEGDWWSYEIGETDDDGVTPVEITVAPLAEGVHKNWSMVNVRTLGASTPIYLLQDDGSSVNSVATTSTSAKVVNGNFEVESANATAVAVYNLAGQKVAETTFDGKATVAAADLAKGVYVLKFNNNVVVKLAK